MNWPQLFSNDLTTQINVRSVACYVEGGGSVTMQIELRGKGPTSILKQPVVCGDQVWTAGVLNGVPVLRSFAKNGAACLNEPCTMDVKMVGVEGAPTYLIFKVVGLVPRGGGARKKGR